VKWIIQNRKQHLTWLFNFFFQFLFISFILSPTNDDETPPGIHLGESFDFLSPADDRYINLTIDHSKPFTRSDRERSNEFVEQLLHRLRRISDVAPLHTYTFIPKSFLRRYSAQASLTLAWWIREYGRRDTSRDLNRTLTISLYLTWFDFILTRNTKFLDLSSNLDSEKIEDPMHTSHIIKYRLHLIKNVVINSND